ncbi:MAG: NAD-dependent epimerase/dehydratase family protein [Bryobacteraceae bacterium]
MHRRILVTGGAGFVGTNLCLAIKERFPGIEVTALDSLHRRGSELNLSKLSAAGVRFEQGDVRVRSDLTSTSLNPDLIIECSAEPSAQAGYGGSPEFLMETNLTGAYHCLELARLSKADIIFISTSRVYPYGKLNELPFQEEDTRYAFSGETLGLTASGISESFPLEGARSLYGTTKLAAELLVEEYADAYGFRFIIDRFGVLTGPGQMAKSDQGVIALWVAAHTYQRKLGYIGFGGTGKQVRDFLHIQDFCRLLLDQIEHFDTYKGQRFNVGGGIANSLSLLETTALCRQITGKEIPMGSIPENRPADVRIYITDHSRVSSVRGWKPQCDAHSTLSDIHKWLIDGGEALRNTMFPA